MKKSKARKPRTSTPVQYENRRKQLAFIEHDITPLEISVQLESPVGPRLFPTKRDKIIEAAVCDGVGSKRKYAKLKNIQFKRPRSKRSGLRRWRDEEAKALAGLSEAKFMDPFSESSIRMNKSNLSATSQEMSLQCKKPALFPIKGIQQNRTNSEPKPLKMKLKLDSGKHAFKQYGSPSSSQRSIVSWLDKTPPPPKQSPLRDYSKRKRTKANPRYSSMTKSNRKPKDAPRRRSRTTSRSCELEEKYTSTSEETRLWQRKLDLVPSKYIKQVCIPAVPELSTVSPSSVNSVFIETGGRMYSSSNYQQQRQEQQATPPLSNDRIEVESKGKGVKPPNKASEAKNVCLASCQPDFLTRNPPMHLSHTENMVSKNTNQHTLCFGSTLTSKEMGISIVNNVRQTELEDVKTNIEQMDTAESDVDSAVGSGEEGQFSHDVKGSKEPSYDIAQQVKQDNFTTNNPKRRETVFPQNMHKNAEDSLSTQMQTCKANANKVLKETPDSLSDSHVILRSIIKDLKHLSDNYSKLLLHQTKNFPGKHMQHDLPSHSASVSSAQGKVASNYKSSYVESSPSNSLESVRLISPVLDENVTMQQDNSNSHSLLDSLRESCYQELGSTTKQCDEFFKQFRQVSSHLHSTKCKQITPWNKILVELKQISAICNKLLNATSHLMNFISKQ